MPRAKILIVEDESIVSLDIKNRLLGLGYQVVGVASSGEMAIQLTSEYTPDVILMDIMLKGGIDGIETADVIRKRFEIPLVYVTAHADLKTMERAKQTDPYGFLVKPFHNDELQGAIEMALYKHKVEKSLRDNLEWFFVTLNSIGDAVIATDVDESIVFINTIAERMLGWKSEEVVGKPLKSVFVIIDEETRKPLEVPTSRVFRESFIVGLPNYTILTPKNSEAMPIYT